VAEVSGDNIPTRGVNDRVELSIVLSRQIIEILSAAEADRNMATATLNAVLAHIGTLHGGVRI